MALISPHSHNRNFINNRFHENIIQKFDVNCHTYVIEINYPYKCMQGCWNHPPTIKALLTLFHIPILDIGAAEAFSREG